MRKLAVLFAVCALFASAAFADEPQVLVMNGRTMVPVRYVAESFGASVQYDSRTRGVSFSLDYQQVGMTVDSRAARVGDRDVELDTAAMVVGGVTYVPVRFVSEAFGFEVSWSSVDRQVIVIQPKTKKQIVLVVTDKPVPPGLAKKGGVPPGLAKKGGLPPGQAKKHTDVTPIVVINEEHGREQKNTDDHGHDNSKHGKGHQK